jgi:hypothetical protein
MKKAMFGIFYGSSVASQLEVTTSKDCMTLLSFCLTEKCGVAKLVFDTTIKTEQGTPHQPVKLMTMGILPLLLPIPSKTQKL